MSLPLVDVNNDTALQTWPLLLDAVQKAHFIALDLELSGLGNLMGTGRGPTMEERYMVACETVNSRAVLSLGIACFQWRNSPTAEPSPLLSRTSQPPPYNCHNSENAPSSNENCDSADPSISSSVSVAARVFNIWLMSQKAYTIDPLSAQFLLQHGFDFNKQVAKGIPYSPGPMGILEGESVSIHSLLATILATGAPVVVHNGWIDLLFLYGTFYAPLPPSLGTLTADLSEMFECGVYDTKAIAQFEFAEQATFLEYVFRKCQRDNEALKSANSPHLHLYLPSLPHPIPTELVPVSPLHTPSVEEAADISICNTFAKYGYCHKANCSDSHNVLLVLLQHEHELQIKQMKKKRKRELKNTKAAKPEDDCSPPSKQRCSGAAEDTLEPSQDTDLSSQFLLELEAAQLRFAAETNDTEVSEQATISSTNQDTDSTTSPPSPANLSSPTHTPDSSTAPHGQKPSFGHRAGFDAFMTGYVFAYYAQTKTCSNSHQLSSPNNLTLDKAMIMGLSPMRNRLSNRNKPVPLILTKSQFTHTSKAHRENCAKIAELKKLII